MINAAVENEIIPSNRFSKVSIKKNIWRYWSQYP
jgi:hypothetical protein